MIFSYGFLLSAGLLRLFQTSILHLASHAGVFRGARISSLPTRVPLKTHAWEAILHLGMLCRIWLEKIWPPKVTNFIFKICQYIINKISLQQRWGKKPPPTKTRKRNTLGINSQAGAKKRGGGRKMLKIGSNQRCEQRDGERSKGGEHMEKRP